MAMPNRSEVELNLTLSKIYLYLGHHYMDLHYYDRALSLAEKCRNLWVDKDNSTSHCKEVNIKIKYNILCDITCIYFLSLDTGSC